MRNAKSICFVNGDNYPVLNPQYGGNYIGGESVQQVLLSKAFSTLDYRVTNIVADFGQPDGEFIDGIQVWKTCAARDGFPVLRFVHPRLTSLYKALKKADSDIYYQSCAGVPTGVAAYFCARHNRKFIFRVAHDTDCIPGKQLIKYWRDRKIYEYGLKRADLIAVQSDQQADLLKEYYGLESQNINMVVQLPSASEPSNKDIDVLWVNNIREFKRPDLVLDIARRIPELKITMIGGPCEGYETLSEDIKRQAAALPNLDYLGFVPYHQINEYYARAKLFMNTSDSEGFPNSFLQSWIRGVPVISFFDPDGIIKREGVGASPNTIAEMVDDVKTFVADDAVRMNVSDVVSEYAFKNYAPDTVVRQYVADFEQMGMA